MKNQPNNKEVSKKINQEVENLRLDAWERAKHGLMTYEEHKSYMQGIQDAIRMLRQNNLL